MHLVSKPASHSSHSSHHCQKRKSKRVDEVYRLRVGLSAGFKWVLRTYTLSQYFVSTLCRIRFVSTLCPYALSKAERKIKRVDEVGRLRVSLRVGLEWVLRSHSLSPHFVTPLCRLRFVPTLRPYALSECEKGASVRYSPAKERSCVGGSASG